MGSLRNILWLGFKEFRSLVSDTVMMLFVVYAFTLAIYSQATGTSNEVNNASIAFADEDRSALSAELFNAFYPPRFQLPDLISTSQIEDMMDRGKYMFVVSIPASFEAVRSLWKQLRFGLLLAVMRPRLTGRQRAVNRPR